MKPELESMIIRGNLKKLEKSNLNMARLEKAMKKR